MELWKCLRFCSPLLLICVLVTLFLQLLLQLWLEWREESDVHYQHQITEKYSLNEVDDFVLVWWTPFTGNSGSFLQCGNLKCFITQDRLFQYHPKFQMFLFYGSNLEIGDLPLPRKNQHIWSLFHEESPKNIPFLSHEKGISLFNYTATFSRTSDVPLTLQYIKSFESLTDHQYYVTIENKNKLLEHLSPVLYVQSDCDTPLDRDKYVEELMKYIPVDSYGSCLHNKDLPDSMSHPESMTSEEFLHFTAQYKFTIAFENAVCDDYITEKLWRPLTVGSVPIYMGSPSVQDWLPSLNSAILAVDFSSPKQLAAHISYLNSNDDKYLSFLSHKESMINTGNINFNTKMKPDLWGSLQDNRYHFIDQFECEMCIRASHNSKGNLNRKVATQKEYFCPKPLSSLTGQEDSSNPWLHLWEYSKCEASLLAEIIQGGHQLINQTVFYHEALVKMRESGCS